MINPQEEYNKTHYLYTPLFCEENIWQLVLSLSKTNQKINMSEMWVLMITNPDKKIALINQQAAAINQAIIWDYHVILLVQINHHSFIFDFDTRLPFVTTLQNYIRNTFIPANNLPPEFIPYIRKIPAQLYLEQFYSDRSHMQNHVEQSEFPPWPIINAGIEHSIALADYLDIEYDLNDKRQVLKVSSTAILEQWLTSSPRN